MTVTGIFVVTFALSIDYQVFLLTRMREEYVRTQSNKQAVRFGIEHPAAHQLGRAVRSTRTLRRISQIRVNINELQIEIDDRVVQLLALHEDGSESADRMVEDTLRFYREVCA